MIQDHFSDQFVPEVWDIGANKGPEKSQIGDDCEEWDKQESAEGWFEGVSQGGGGLEQGEDEEGHEEGLGELIHHEGTCEDEVRPEVVAFQTEPKTISRWLKELKKK